MTSLNPKFWTLVYTGKMCNVYETLHKGESVFQTADRLETSPGWRYCGDDLAFAKNAADNFKTIEIDPSYLSSLPRK